MRIVQHAIIQKLVVATMNPLLDKVYESSTFRSTSSIALSRYAMLTGVELTYDPNIQHCWRLCLHQTQSVEFFLASIRA
jgi:hypothetical protein